MELQVLVATTNQEDFSLVNKMNLRQNAIIANQCGQWKEDVQINEFGTIKMLSSNTVGVGRNRNLAIQMSEADILLFADDDITYYDAELKEVINAFRQLPEADVIFFAIDMSKEGIVFEERRHKLQRLYLWNSLKYGACRMAVRRSAILKYRLDFSLLFGGGADYCSGEDTIFIRECFRNGLKVYAHPYVLGKCSKDSSSWFTGYHENFFFDRGAMVACAFPKIKKLVILYYALRYKSRTTLSVSDSVKIMLRGVKAFSGLEFYQKKGRESEQ